MKHPLPIGSYVTKPNNKRAEGKRFKILRYGTFATLNGGIKGYELEDQDGITSLVPVGEIIPVQ